ncbi:CDF-like metal transporter [Ramaria rubella]|nr:CDF-like metal transporter [Ramaria rubella]
MSDIDESFTQSSAPQLSLIDELSGTVDNLGTTRDTQDSGPTSGTTTTQDFDLEKSSHSPDSDPDLYMFRRGFKSDDELLRIRKSCSGGKKIERYQRKQNELIDNLLKPMERHTSEAQEQEEAARLPVKIAVWASLGANFALCVIQLYAAISSLSLSLLATGIDSIFDIGSNVMLVFLHRKANSLDVNKWPVGGARLETIGNIVYGALMGSVNLVVTVESVRTLITHSGNDTNSLHVPSLIAVGAALGVKLVLFLYCFGLRKSSSQVRMLWEDHRNDLWINTFGILMSAGGSKLKWYLDPMGGMIIALGVIVAWTRTMYFQFALLAGKSAPHEFLQLIIYKAMTFSDEIEKLDTVRAYHSGPDYFVEVDVVMPANTELWRAHDLAQRLQDKIELLPNVERAFVHVDHETEHRPEHRKYV